MYNLKISVQSNDIAEKLLIIIKDCFDVKQGPLSIESIKCTCCAAADIYGETTCIEFNKMDSMYKILNPKHLEIIFDGLLGYGIISTEEPILMTE